MHSVSVTPIYQLCEQSVNSFCFLSFLFLFFVFVFVFVLGGGGEGEERRGNGGSMSFDVRYFFPKVSFTLFYMFEPFY